MKDWKKELRKKQEEWAYNPYEPVLFKSEVMETFIDSLLSEQDEKHKKQIREAIEEALDTNWSLIPTQNVNSVEDLQKRRSEELFKKYNCEEEKK